MVLGGLVDEVLRFATPERAVAHVAAGWVPKVPAIDDKLELTATLESSLTRASELRRHGTDLCERDEGAVRSNPARVGSLPALDSSGNPARVARERTCELPAVLRARCEDLHDRLDPSSTTVCCPRCGARCRTSVRASGPTPTRSRRGGVANAQRTSRSPTSCGRRSTGFGSCRARRDDRGCSRARALTSAVRRASRTMTSQASSMTA